MKIGFIGLGRMGARIVERLLEKKFEVVVFDANPAAISECAKKGAIAASSVEDLCAKLGAKKIIWLMVPAGKPVDELIGKMAPDLKKGDTVVDGGNSFYKDSIRRAEELGKVGVEFFDVGTSGGLEGAKNGACLTVGGGKPAYERIEPVLEAIACKDGYLYVGPSGAGHYVKMVHNAIEYGMLESYAEGFEMLYNSPKEYVLNLPAIAKVWGNGSVIRSWMLELAQKELQKNARLDGIEGVVGGGETGAWAVKDARERNVQVPLFELALVLRKSNRFAGRLISVIRNAFGGHEVRKE